VIENEEIYGTVTIEAPGVIIRNSWIYSEGFWTVWAPAGFLTIENSVIGHPDHINQRGIGGDNITMRAVEIHHVEDGVKIGSNSTYEGLYIHDLRAPGPDGHTDAIQDDGGAHDSVVRGSYIESEIPGGTSAILIKSDAGLGHDLLFEGNYINGGAYSFYSRDGGHGVPYNITVRNNRFGRDYFYGLFDVDGDGVTFEGNMWDDTSEPVDVTSEVPSNATPAAPAPPTVAPAPPTGGATTVVSTTTTLAASSTTAPLSTSTVSLVAAAPDAPSGGDGVWSWVIIGTLLFVLGATSALAAASFWRRSQTG
jgi:hypothetical protein